MNSNERAATVQAVHNLFIWLNEMSASGGEIKLADVQRIFTADTTMTLNNRFICRGHEGQLQHSRDLMKKTKFLRFNLPFEQTIVEGDSVVGYYTCDFVSRDGVTGRVYDMCIWTVRDGKIASILENVVFEGQQVEVEEYH